MTDIVERPLEYMEALGLLGEARREIERLREAVSFFMCCVKAGEEWKLANYRMSREGQPEGGSVVERAASALIEEYRKIWPGKWPAKPEARRLAKAAIRELEAENAKLREALQSILVSSPISSISTCDSFTGTSFRRHAS